MYNNQDDFPDPGRLPRCPDGNAQRPCRILGFRERNVGELELRVVLGYADYGVCQLDLDERDEEVHVSALVCYDESRWAEGCRRPKTDCPVRSWLTRPLGDRAVIDADTDQELDLFIPAYLDNVPQPDHGYHPANRRLPHPD